MHGNWVKYFVVWMTHTIMWGIKPNTIYVFLIVCNIILLTECARSDKCVCNCDQIHADAERCKCMPFSLNLKKKKSPTTNNMWCFSVCGQRFVVAFHQFHCSQHTEQLLLLFIYYKYIILSCGFSDLLIHLFSSKDPAILKNTLQ